ncbi:hypothetical protein [Desulfomonile tiedjei]|uniref:YceK/YidQ family lipoprotein n=1 Tax=Desulfomonile tiedjei (strain ATCC 49306 / DSM 6799 / DCB-1) TaxID=706587 RepID=I4CA55_DESTA|nr:hypothetical protein [Desulfomonile tiedjei]AFM26446.1 hypothetical protein Desti_3804 [Desulfomonile tiedjei DSM 6799]
MKFRVYFTAMVVVVFLASCLIANAATAPKGTYTVYDAKNKCQVVCKAPKPALEILEDGLAYLLDIPLAILSPITCPLVTPVLDRIDPVEARSFPRRIK